MENHVLRFGESGLHKTNVGNFELTILSDGEYFLDGGTFFGVIPKVMWQRKWEPDEKNRLRAGLNSVLVRGGEKTVLIETGIGNKQDAEDLRARGEAAAVV